MADTIKIGNLEIDNLKVGTLSVDALYIGDVKIYPQGEPPTPPVGSPKYVLTLSDSSTISARCDGTSAVTSGEVSSQYSGSVVSAEIGDCVTSIGDYAFINCRSLTSCTIGSGVTTIGNAAFINCSGLTGNFDIPNSVSTIGSNAFRPCSSLTSITIGTGITSINMYAFYGCSSLTSITINATTPPRLSDANAFGNTNNCPIYVPCDSVDAYKAASGWSSLASRITCVQPKTLQWVTFNNGDVIPSDLDIYGFSGVSQNLNDTFGYGTHFQFTPSRNKFDWFIVDNNRHTCYFGESVLNTEVISVIFSEVSCDDYYNQGATVSGTIQLYIYA